MGAQIASAVLQAGHRLVATARRKESLANLQHSEDVLSLGLDVTIDDYQSTVGKTRAFADEHNHQQPGDPAKLAKALLELATLPDPPVRLQLGSDAVKRIEEKNAFVNRESQRWFSLSKSTDMG